MYCWDLPMFFEKQLDFLHRKIFILSGNTFGFVINLILALTQWIAENACRNVEFSDLNVLWTEASWNMERQNWHSSSLKQTGKWTGFCLSYWLFKHWKTLGHNLSNYSEYVTLNFSMRWVFMVFIHWELQVLWFWISAICPEGIGEVNIQVQTMCCWNTFCITSRLWPQIISFNIFY